MKKVTKKIFGWKNAFRLAASLERLPAEAEFFVLAFGSSSYSRRSNTKPAKR
jgi:hypothetical protein